MWKSTDSTLYIHLKQAESKEAIEGKVPCHCRVLYFYELSLAGMSPQQNIFSLGEGAVLRTTVICN